MPEEFPYPCAKKTSLKENPFDKVVPVYNWLYPLKTDTTFALPGTRKISIWEEASAFGVIGRALYFHIPFCETICTFCPFVRGTFNDNRIISQYADALVKEIYLRSTLIDRTIPINSVFFGGGTPSLLSERDIYNIGNAIHKLFPMSYIKEFSVEMEVKSVTKRMADAFLSIGATHARFGVQTFNEKYRRIFNLTATERDIDKAIDLLNPTFKHVSFDMMYGFKGQTINECVDDLVEAKKRDVNLLDYYPINNSSTQLKMHKTYKSYELSDTNALYKLEMKRVIHDNLRDSGYVQHNGHGFVRLSSSETPKFKDNLRPYTFQYHKHVYGYSDVDVIGFGVNAISVTKNIRFQNTGNRNLYINSIINNDDCPTAAGYISDRSIESRPVIFHLPYHGYLDAASVKWDRVYPEIHNKLKCLKNMGLIKISRGNDIELTQLGTFWYVNIMFYLLPEDEQHIISTATLSALRVRDPNLYKIDTNLPQETLSIEALKLPI